MMTKQEEVDKILIKYTGKTGEHLDAVKRELSEAGVVIKGEGELPNENSGKHNWYDDDYGEAGRIGYRFAQQDMLTAGWVKEVNAKNKKY